MSAGAQPLLTAEEVAERYQVKRQTVLQWFHQGIIPAEVAVGKIYRFDPEKVARALTQKTREKQAAAGSGSKPLMVPVL